MIQAGKWDQRITLQRRVPGRDAAGQPVTAWASVAPPVWADVRHQRGLEAIKAGAVTSVVQASINMAYREDIDSGMRAVHGTVVYEIKAVLPDRKREFIDLVCEVVT